MDRIAENIKKLVRLSKQPDGGVLPPIASEIVKEIVEDLVWDPGLLIYLPERGLMNEAQQRIDALWESMDRDKLLDDMFAGGFGGLLVELADTYIERAKLLKPTFVAVDPSDEVSTYFRQAMHAWIHGLDCAALILCWSVIEKLIKEILCKRNPGLVYDIGDGKSFRQFREKKRKELIQNAEQQGLLNKRESKMVKNISKLRDDAVHRLKGVKAEATYRAILETKSLLERLLEN